MNFSRFPQGKLLLITNDYPPQKGGVSWYYENLVRRLNVEETPSRSPFARGRQRVEVLKLGEWTMTPLWPLIIIPVLLKTLKLKTEAWWVGQVLPVGTVVWLLSRVWRKPYIVSTHGMDVLVPLKSGRKRWLVRKVLEGAEMITANSEWTKQKIMEHYFLSSKFKVQSSKLVVIYPEAKPKRNVTREEVNALRLKLRIPEGAKVLLTVSRLVARKGIDRVLAALPEVWKKIPEVPYVVVGDGEERGKFEKMVGARQCLARTVGALHATPVHFVGNVTDEELAAYYTMADAFILLPREEEGDTEGFGIVYAEANQYGLPVIGCVSGGTAEALAQCKDVIMVDNADDPKEVAGKICQAFQ